MVGKIVRKMISELVIPTAIDLASIVRRTSDGGRKITAAEREELALVILQRIARVLDELGLVESGGADGP